MTGHTAEPYTPGMSDLIEDCVAGCEKRVRRIPERMSCLVHSTPFGFVVSSAKCVWPHPCFEPEHVAFGLLFTADEWEQIEALCEEFTGPVDEGPRLERAR